MTAERLFDRLTHWAREKPLAEAATDSNRKLTYSQLHAEVRAFASVLIEAGVRRGDRVTMLAPPSVDFLVSFLASAAIGAIWVGLNPRHTPHELSATLERLEARAVCVGMAPLDAGQEAWLAGLPETVARISLRGPFRPSGGQEEALEAAVARVRPDDPCLIVFTSGTTGRPKGAVIDQASLIGASGVQASQWPVEPLRVLNNLPINHIGCVGDLACWTLVAGGTSVFCEQFDPAASIRLIWSERITVWAQVPTMFQLTLAAPEFDREALGSLELIFWGGARASADLIEQLRTLCPWVATSYGQTETVGSVTFTGRDAPLASLTATVGKAVAPYSLRIVNPEGQPLPQGEAGEIQVRTPFGMQGYWRDADATAQVILADGWRRTGDIGRLTQAGEVELIGRVHDVFKSGGYNIYPAEIEAALESHPAVEQASIIAVPNETFGEVGVAFVVLGSGESATADTLRDHLRSRLANYKIPKEIAFASELPRLAVGKVDKAALRTGYCGHSP